MYIYKIMVQICSAYRCPTLIIINEIGSFKFLIRYFAVSIISYNIIISEKKHNDSIELLYR